MELEGVQWGSPKENKCPLWSCKVQANFGEAWKAFPKALSPRTNPVVELGQSMISHFPVLNKKDLLLVFDPKVKESDFNDMAEMVEWYHSICDIHSDQDHPDKPNKNFKLMKRWYVVDKGIDASKVTEISSRDASSIGTFGDWGPEEQQEQELDRAAQGSHDQVAADNQQDGEDVEFVWDQATST